MLLDTPRVRSRLDLLYIVTQEFNAGLDIEQVLNRVLAATVASVGGADASLFLFDAKENLENFIIINNFEVEQRSQPTVKAILDYGLAGWVKEHRKGAVVVDTATDERWYTDDNNEELRKVGSAVAVPIQLPEQLIGILVITAPQPRYFDQSDLSMLTILADQAAFAIANARLFEAEQHRRRFSDTLISVARTINSTLNLNKVLDLILEQLALVIDYDSSSILLCSDEDDNILTVRAVRHIDQAEDVLNMAIPITEDSPNYRAISQKKPVAIGDVDAEPDWIKIPATQNVRSWIGAPLIARDKVIGMLTVDSHEVHKYTKENIQEVAAFADQAATAVANAQIVTRLKNAETSYTALFEDSTDMILISTYQGLVLNVNRKACQMLRRTKDALIGGDISFIYPGLKDYLSEQTRRLKAWREASVELDVLDAYRQTISLELKARQVHYAGKDCVQWVGRDISARKEAERLRQDLVNMLVHDLRGPLGNLINTIELMPMVVGPTIDNPSLQNILNMAKRSGQEVRDLVDSMLDISRLEQGELPLQYEEVEIEAMVEAIKDQILPRATAKEMELILKPVPKAPPIYIDGSMIRRVLLNLLDNAIKYTPAYGQVSLTTSLTEDTVCFAVSDNGPGISKADQNHIFNKFSRVIHSANAPSGVGLGLAFCKLAAEAHGGIIFVESEGVPGQGSTFCLSIPLTPNQHDD